MKKIHIKLTTVFLALLIAFTALPFAAAAAGVKVSDTLQTVIDASDPHDVIPVYVGYRYADRPSLKAMPSYPGDIDAACNELREAMLSESMAVADRMRAYADFEVVEYMQYSNVILIDIEAASVVKLTEDEEIFSLHYNEQEVIPAGTIPEGVSRKAYRRLSADLRTIAAQSQPDDVILATVYRYGGELLLSDAYAPDFTFEELVEITKAQTAAFAAELSAYGDFTVVGEALGVLNIKTTASQLCKIAMCDDVEAIYFAGQVASTMGDADDDGEVTVFDVTYIQRWLAGMADATDIDLSLADVDGDGEVTIFDATEIQRSLAGMG